MLLLKSYILISNPLDTTCFSFPKVFGIISLFHCTEISQGCTLIEVMFQPVCWALSRPFQPDGFSGKLVLSYFFDNISLSLIHLSILFVFCFGRFLRFFFFQLHPSLGPTHTHRHAYAHSRTDT